MTSCLPKLGAARLCNQGCQRFAPWADSISARYTALVSGWNGGVDEELRRKARAFAVAVPRTSWNCGAAIIARNGCGSIWTGLQKQTRATQSGRWEAVIKEVKQWSGVREAFKDDSSLLRQRKTGKPLAQPAQGKIRSHRTGIKVNQARSNQ